MRRPLCAVILFCCLPVTGAALAATHRVSSLTELSTSAARIFRGTCVKVDTGTVTIAGARLSMTAYTFRVTDRLKGVSGASTITFRQVGIPGGGSADLGQRAGLPVYTQGGDYLLLLLPESRVGLTSPSGAAEAAFEITRGRAMPLAARPTGVGRPEPSAPLTYEALRREILGQAGPSQPLRR